MPRNEAAEHRQAEGQDLFQELAQLGQLVALRAFAGSLAHEINQPLMGILANTEAALNLIEAPTDVDIDEVQSALLDIKRSSRRAAYLVRRLLEPLRAEALEQRPLAINEMVGAVARLVSRHVADRGIAIELELEPNPPPAFGHRLQLQQVVLQLLLNACDAVGEVEPNRRVILVRTERASGDLVVRVRDWGVGGTHTDLGRIFEPFYTTKALRLGMGLAMCRTIVLLHGGRLWAEPNAESGLTFAFTLQMDDREGPTPATG